MKKIYILIFTLLTITFTGCIQKNTSIKTNVPNNNIALEKPEKTQPETDTTTYSSKKYKFLFKYPEKFGEVTENNKSLKFSNSDNITFTINTIEDVKILEKKEEDRLANCNEEDCGPMRSGFNLTTNLWDNELKKISGEINCDKYCNVLEINNTKILVTYYSEWPGALHKRYTFYSGEYRIDISILAEGMYNDLSKFQKMENRSQIFLDLNQIVNTITLVD